jgi:polyisoprenyl-teichoic acid--peptidoglycan teichoic acid transferase
VQTDIPRSALDDFVDLAFLVQEAAVRSVVFDSSVIDPAYPDYDLIRGLVQDAIAPATAPPADGGTTTSSSPSAETSAPTPDPAAPDDAAGAVTDVADACAYDPAQAEAALAQGEPETRNG